VSFWQLNWGKKQLKRQPVSSSRIISIGYDPKRSLLEIEFREHGIYQYSAVPERIYKTFLSVVSKGRFFDGVIKDKFHSRKVR